MPPSVGARTDQGLPRSSLPSQRQSGWTSSEASRRAMRSCGTGPVRSLPVLAQPPSSVRIHRSARCRPGRTWPVPLRACLPVTREPPLPVRAFAAPGLAAQPCKHVCLAQHAKPKHMCATTLHVPEGQRGNMQAAAKRCPCGGGRRVYGRPCQRSHPRRCSLVLARLRVATRPPCPDWWCRLPAALKTPGATRSQLS